MNRNDEPSDAGGEGCVTSVIHEVVSRVGLPFGLSIAQRAQRCADELLAMGDETAIRYMLVEGWERELSRQFTLAKTSAKRATAAIVASGTSFADGNGLVAQQLGFPIIVPGRPPVPLAQATHALIAAALDAEEAQMKGRQQNIALLRRVARVTAQWPEQTVSALLAARLVTLEDIFREAA